MDQKARLTGRQLHFAAREGGNELGRAGDNLIKNFFMTSTVVGEKVSFGNLLKLYS